MKKSLVFIFSFLLFVTIDVHALTKQQYKQKTASELTQLIRNQETTPLELVNLAYEVIEEENPMLHAVITTQKQLAIEKAKNIIDNGQPFFGVPLLVKGLGPAIEQGEDTYGLITNKNKPLTKKNQSLANQYEKLGFIIIGQTNYGTYGLRNVSVSSLYETAKNAWDSNYHAGGSSGGSGAAVASGMTPIATGSDAGGSIRIPASFNGVIGLKPSAGITLGSSKDSLAVQFPITKSMNDTIQLFQYHKNTKPGYETIQVNDIKTLKIGYTTKSIMNTSVSEDAKKAVENAVAFLKQQGFVVEEVDITIDGRKLMEDYTLNTIKYGAVFKDIDKQLEALNLTKNDIDPLVWGLFVTYRDYDKKLYGQQVKEMKKHFEIYKNQLNALFEEYPIIITPTTAQVAPKLTDKYVSDEDKQALYNIETLSLEERMQLLNRQWELMLIQTPFTQLANVTNTPALSLPTYVNKNNLPLGIMLSGKWGMDEVLLQFGKLFEQQNQLKISRTIKEDGYVKDISMVKEGQYVNLPIAEIEKVTNENLIVEKEIYPIETVKEGQYVNLPLAEIQTITKSEAKQVVDTGDETSLWMISGILSILIFVMLNIKVRNLT